MRCYCQRLRKGPSQPLATRSPGSYGYPNAKTAAEAPKCVKHARRPWPLNIHFASVILLLYLEGSLLCGAPKLEGEMLIFQISRLCIKAKYFQVCQLFIKKPNVFHTFMGGGDDDGGDDDDDDDDGGRISCHHQPLVSGMPETRTGHLHLGCHCHRLGS